jgi:glutamyl/glutaminyl-tRNA synthetase
VLVTRFAPSPTGYLHLGHVRSAWEGWRAARDAGGRFLLRIEDIDHTRCRPEFEAAIRDDLAWLGLDWDGPVRRQSEHFADYRAALDRLDAAGLLYPCFCTRRDIRAEIARAGGAPQGELGPAYPAPAAASARPSARRGWPPPAITRCASTPPRPSPAAARSTGSRATGALPSIPPRSAMSCWRARTFRRATTSPSPSTMRCRASPW